MNNIKFGMIMLNNGIGGTLACNKETRNVYKIVVGKCKAKRRSVDKSVTLKYVFKEEEGESGMM